MTYEFETQIVQHHINGYTYQRVVYLPEHLVLQLPFDRYPRLRVEATIGDEKFEAAWQPGKGLKFLMIPKDVLKRAGLSPLDFVRVTFHVIDQDKVTLPLELQEALDANSDALWMWEGLTAGRRRGYAYKVASAKRADTRVRRAAEVVAELAED